MTKKRKEELRQLLEEAIENLKIRHNLLGWLGLPSLELGEYRGHLNRAWTSHSEESSWIVDHYRLEIESNIESKLLGFIKTEMSPFIYEDKILSPALFILSDLFIHDFFSIVSSNRLDGTHLNQFLEQLLKIAISRGIEESISAFARCTENTDGFFQTIALLGGITLKEEIQVFEGIRLVPISNSTSGIPHYCRSLPNVNPGNFLNKTLLVIDYSVFPIFHNPFLSPSIEDKWSKQRDRFRFKRKGGEYPEFDKLDFHTEFCRALSLTCNSAVQIAMIWNYIAEDELFKMNHKASSISPKTLSGNSTEAEDIQIDQAKSLYRKLVDPHSKLSVKLEIPINRWIKSKTNQKPEDKIIDLAIALESLYLSDIPEPTELSFRLRLHASWHLRKKIKDRKELMKVFSKIYEWRSSVVHNGKLPEKKISKKKKRPYTQEEIGELITTAQNLCQESIMKIIEDEKFPDWSNLILGCIDI